LNLVSPKTFNEKIIWLKTFHNDESYQHLVDKSAARDYVRDILGEDFLVPMHYQFDDVQEIKKVCLPNKFILKMNHGSGMNIPCYDKGNFNLKEAVKKLTFWKTINYYNIGKELPYKNIKPRVLCEELLGDKNGIEDYKIFCFGGEPLYIQLDYDRNTSHKRIFYDLNWKSLPFTTLYPRGSAKFPKPERLPEILDAARKLSKGLPFARVDFYYYFSKIYFGEITLHHGGGFEPFIPHEYDAILGSHIKL